jgi:pilus assembly protein Flp/PilA
MKRDMQNFWNDTQGQDLVEYALAAGLVAVVAVGALPALGTSVSSIFTKITSTFSAIP